MSAVADVKSGHRVARFRGWAKDFKVDQKGNVILQCGILPDDRYAAMRFTDHLDGSIMVIEVYAPAPTPKKDMDDLARLREKMGHHPSGSVLPDEDIIDLTEGRVMAHRRILPWVFVMSNRPHE